MPIVKFIAILITVFVVNILAIRLADKRNNEKIDEAIDIANSSHRADAPAFLTDGDIDAAACACAQILEDFLTEYGIYIPSDEREDGDYDEPAIMDKEWHILKDRLNKELNFYILRKG